MKHLNHFEQHLKRFNESVLGNLLNHKQDDVKYYTYLGETGSDIWFSNLSKILSREDSISMTQDDRDYLNDLFQRKHGRNKEENNPVQYPPLTKVQNSRFSYCWFLGQIDKEESTQSVFRRHSWDICIQFYSEDYFLVNIGSGNGYHNYWYWCDRMDGLEKLIKDKLLS